MKRNMISDKDDNIAIKKQRMCIPVGFGGDASVYIDWNPNDTIQHVCENISTEYGKKVGLFNVTGGCELCATSTMKENGLDPQSKLQAYVRDTFDEHKQALEALDKQLHLGCCVSPQHFTERGQLLQFPGVIDVDDSTGDITHFELYEKTFEGTCEM